MTHLYSLAEMAPDPPPGGDHWIAPSAVLIGNILLKCEASIWIDDVSRADDDVIEIGECSNAQDGCVFHADPGCPLIIGVGCTIGHKVMLHGCTIGSNTLIDMCSMVLNGARIDGNCQSVQTC